MAYLKRSSKAFRAITRPGSHSDGGGLYLNIVGGSRTWMFRYKCSGKGHWMGLGPERLVTLADARDAAIDAARLLRQGIDPIEARRSAKSTKAPPNKSFEVVADEYIAAHRAAWKNAKHAKQWRATLEVYAFPKIGSKAVESISVDDVLNCLKPIWEVKPETASRLRGRIESTLDYAKTRNWRTGENPARWKGHLDNLLPARAKLAPVVHHAALAWSDLPVVMKKLGALKGTSALCLRFIILTAARSGEARGARWSEIDVAAKVWTVPPDRMKAARAHRVPLSRACLSLLEEILPLKTSGDGLVFPGARKEKPLSDVAVSKALASVSKGVTVHGMRSTFRDWAAERVENYPREIAEAALAHTNRDKVEAAYRRSDFFERRAGLMKQWAEFCVEEADAPSAPASVVASNDPPAEQSTRLQSGR